MANTNKKLHRIPVYRRPIFIVGAAVAVVVAVLVLTKTLNQTPENPVSDTKLPNASTTSPSTPTTTPSAPNQTPDEPEKVTQFEGQDPNALNELTGNITYHGIENGTLTVVSSIDQYISDGGNCHISLTFNNRTVYSADKSIAAEVSTSVCGPFEIPTIDFSPGSYQITITVTGNGKTGTITGTTTI